MSENTVHSIGEKVRLEMDFEGALARTVEALKAEGFGVLTEIDVKETMKKKLGVDFPPYKILGACNPPLAHRALMAEPEVGLLLPCNVTVRQLEDGTGDGGTVVEVALVDPLSMLGVVPSQEVRPVAEEAASRLKRVKAALEHEA
jgi:uncharacterized protein (DUF302 family)